MDAHPENIAAPNTALISLIMFTGLPHYRLNLRIKPLLVYK
jgi:hypothetical protein